MNAEKSAKNMADLLLNKWQIKMKLLYSYFLDGASTSFWNWRACSIVRCQPEDKYTRSTAFAVGTYLPWTTFLQLRRFWHVLFRLKTILVNELMIDLILFDVVTSLFKLSHHSSRWYSVHGIRHIFLNTSFYDAYQ